MEGTRTFDLGVIVEQRTAAQRIVEAAIPLEACADFIRASRWRTVEEFLREARHDPVRTAIRVAAVAAASLGVAVIAAVVERILSGSDERAPRGTAAEELREAIAEEWVLAIELATIDGDPAPLDRGLWPLRWAGRASIVDNPYPFLLAHPEDRAAIIELLAGTLRHLMSAAPDGRLVLPNGRILQREGPAYVVEVNAAAA